MSIPIFDNGNFEKKFIEHKELHYYPWLRVWLVVMSTCPVPAVQYLLVIDLLKHLSESVYGEGRKPSKKTSMSERKKE